MKIFLTGATGLLGSHLLKALLNNGHHIKALHRKGSGGNAIFRHPNLEWVEGTLAHIDILAEAQQDVDAVVHAAALVSFQPSDAELLYQTNVVGTANVVNAALLSSRLKKFIHISSVAALGHPQKNTHVITESNHFDPNGQHSDYAKSKFWAELEVYRAAEEGLNIAIFNPSIILGAVGNGRSSEGLLHYAKNAPQFYPTGNLNYVDVDDVVKIIMHAIHTDAFIGKRCIINAGTVSYKQFFTHTANILHLPPPKWPVDSSLASIAWRLALLKSKFTGHKPMLTKHTARSATKQYVYQSEILPIVMPHFEFKPLSQTLENIYSII